MAGLSPSEISELVKSLEAYFKTDVLYGKGGFFIRGKGHISLPKARKITGIKGKAIKPTMVTGGYGDYATLCKIMGKM